MVKKRRVTAPKASKVSAKRAHQGQVKIIDMGKKRKITKASSQSKVNGSLINGNSLTKTCDVFECFPGKEKASVLEDSKGRPFSVLLQYIDSAHNHHKYYAMQALQIGERQFGCLFWWGRIGSTGRSSLLKAKKMTTAINTFHGKFKAKTGLDWDDRDEPAVEGKYHVVQADHPRHLRAPQERRYSESSSTRPKSRLPHEIQELLRTITRRSTLAAEVRKVEPHFNNTDESPLGSLTPAQLNGGYACLREIEKLMAEDKPNQKKLAEQSEAFYSYIPHRFKASDHLPIINTSDRIKEKAGLLNLLTDAQVALRRLEEAEAIGANGKINYLDSLYKSAGFKLEVIPPDSDTYNLIQEYLMMNHAPSHNFDFKIKAILELKSPKDDRFKDLGNKYLLWHGSRLGAVVGVLTHGLQISSPETPNDRFMFGRGLYFSDTSSESGKYCHAQDGEDAVLMLAEVSLGEVNEKASPDFNAAKKTRGKDSTMGKGRKAPECKEDECKTIYNDVKVPIGPIKKVFARKGQLPLNEYTIYDQTQVW